jgi:hypothetical protein
MNKEAKDLNLVVEFLTNEEICFGQCHLDSKKGLDLDLCLGPYSSLIILYVIIACKTIHSIYKYKYPIFSLTLINLLEQN